MRTVDEFCRWAADQIRHTRTVYATVDEIDRLVEVFRAEPGALTKWVTAKRIARRYRTQAESLDQSRLARALTGLPPARAAAAADDWHKETETLWNRVEAHRRVFGADDAPA
jgi:hypothetical protein